MPDKELLNATFNITEDTPDKSNLLQQACRDYPYFSLAHYFLFKEATPTSIDYNKIAAKAAMHFNNPFYLNYLLTKKVQVKKMAPVVPLTPSSISPPLPGEEIPPPVNEEELASPVNQETEEKVEEKIQAIDKEELLFEPLYTTDYFASQGIKLSEELQPTDKLGKQLKSFTEWLKSMKKIPDVKAEQVDPVDVAVQRFAEKSNQEGEVLTESMAEVYAQQRKPRQAIAIYEKLSLLDPSKSAYFAAKIELLKAN